MHILAATGITQYMNLWDNTCGYLKSFKSFQGCNYKDTIDMVWFANADGDPYKGEFIDDIVWADNRAYKSTTSVTGIRFLNKKKEGTKDSFNWWSSRYEVFEFGPRLRQNFRDFGTGDIGYPAGDKNKYYLMGNGEIDYDPVYIPFIREDDPLWQYPGQNVSETMPKTGALFDILLSSGPITLTPGASTKFVLAIVGGENFHTDPNNFNNNFATNPEAYYSNLDFSDLAKNAMWASWIYDNPGIDTDGDGYYGKYRICILDSVETDNGWEVTKADTSFYEGDGIPDWRAAGPPPAPEFWAEPVTNGIHVRFNGHRSETEKDFMTGEIDFEGYHIWLGRDERATSLSMVASYDILNYDKYYWDKNLRPIPNYLLDDIPQTYEQLSCLYADCDESFNPLDYTRGTPYDHPDFADSFFIFLPHNFNASVPGVTSKIRKIYPDVIDPRTIPPDSISDDMYTDDDYLKFFEYEFTIENVLPTVPYYVNVTAFDFGSPKAGLSPLETSKTLNCQQTYPLSPGTNLGSDNLKAYVYPNPYRKDGDYRSNSYEGRLKDFLPNDKVRSIQFANLPAKCTIRIFSLDGDLVREIHHDFDETDPNRFHDEWNLINRNRQIIVSGLYYWTVEDSSGKVQMGKLVVIM